MPMCASLRAHEPITNLRQARSQLWRQRERWRLNAFRHVAIHATVLADGPGHVSELLGLVRTGPGELRVLR